MISTTFDRHVVLIVDDMPDNLAMLSDALDESGHIVLVATDGLAALQRLDHITPDLILLDAMMPGIDGFETCRRIKQVKRVAHVPVVFMTGLSETEHVVRGFEVGGIDYVTKPIRPQEVVARIGAHIRTARMMSQTRGMLEQAAHAVIVLGGNGLPMWQTSKASQWLEKYFGVRRHRPATSCRGPAGLAQRTTGAPAPGREPGSRAAPGGAPQQDELHITWPARARGMA
jgi:CheY-like chemotaxis protein